MQFSTLFQVLAATAIVSGAAASPVEERGAKQLIELWQDAQFLGLKFSGSGKVNDCQNLPKDFNNNVSSGKAGHGLRCTIWDKRNCQGTGFSFNDNPGAPTLPDWIDNKASSWKCVKA